MRLRYMVSLLNGDRTRMLRFRTARRNVKRQAKRHAADKNRRMRLKERGADNEWGTWRKQLDETMSRWETLVKTHKPGDVILMDIEDFPYTISTRIINDKQPTVQTEGNYDVDKIWTWLIRHRQGRNGGICNRRFISGTTDWTQHSPWPPPDPGSNAVDWFSYPDTMESLYEDANALVAAAKANPQEVPVGFLLVGAKKWSPEGGWQASGAEFHRHLHIQGRRWRFGTPQPSC